ncbi:chondroitinase-B domain-containing protein [Mucilaginibacter terrae]|uniref:Poly(Beta-D-mannuronate) lyase n=1 Tax=Mucilaginibacter terrae TaxID=1955052 RepID=A0ABU3GPS3_9SPHI|nr:chondroitinase-B domain-containing protein [Mucilaginibacter terrae]MDT3401784.1 poly(beta-D-mannuronate) lyase [Mucilaginibacter terrae]
MKKLLCIATMLLVAGICYAEKYTVKSAEDFKIAASKVAPGDEIIIADGTYTNWAVTISKNGTAEKPIVIKAANLERAVFTGVATQPMFKVTGSYVTIRALNFKECVIDKAEGKNGILIQLDNTKHSVISDCIFEKNYAKVQFMQLIIISGNGEHNEVSNCSFTSNANVMDIQVRVAKEDCPQYTLIRNNKFTNKDKVTWNNVNGGECVQVGQDPVLLGKIAANTTVRNNRFINCNAEPEVVSNKSSSNKYIGNYFENCDGELVMRGGHDCLVDSNEFKGGLGGVRVCGTGHTITHNTISDVKTGIRLYYGMASGKNEIGFYIAASNCTITNNTINNVQTGILVGDNKNEDWAGKFDTKRYSSRVLQDIAPTNNTIKDNNFKNTVQTVVYQ